MERKGLSQGVTDFRKRKALPLRIFLRVGSALFIIMRENARFRKSFLRSGIFN
jgi:hypothetical protein